MPYEQASFRPGASRAGGVGARDWAGSPADRLTVLELLAEFGWTLSDVVPEQLAMFVAARNAAPYVEALEIPIATQPEEAVGVTLAEREIQRTLQLTTYRSDDLESRLPTDEMDVALARSVEDLPRIFPTQWLLEEIQPDAFYGKLSGRELLLPIWQRPSGRPEDSQGESSERELIEDTAATDAVKQHAHVLLDTSRTMNDHDRRGIIARGLTLAILLNGYHQRARLNLRPFTATVGELSSGVNHDDLRSIAQRVINLPNSGQTRIQSALEQAVRDIRTSGPCWRADIVLVTDGISRLLENPLGQEKLHTFILGDLMEKEGESTTIATLRQWSTTFHRVWNNRFAEILSPTSDDLEAARAVLDAAIARENHSRSEAETESLSRLVINVRKLLEDFERYQGKSAPLPPEIARLEDLLQKSEHVLPATSQSAPLDGMQTPTASGRILWRQIWHSGGAQGTPALHRKWWDSLRRLAGAIRKWIIHRYRRLFRSKP